MSFNKLAQLETKCNCESFWVGSHLKCACEKSKKNFGYFIIIIIIIIIDINYYGLEA